MGVKRLRKIFLGPGRLLADRFPEGWRRALGYSWAGPFEAGGPENRDEISEPEGRGNRCLLPIRPPARLKAVCNMLFHLRRPRPSVQPTTGRAMVSFDGRQG